jgi:DNA-binding transcriptional LysR family regulator
MTSWNAILGCTAARMGISLLPRMVLRSFPEPKYLSVHPLPEGLNRAPTVLIWRKGAMSPKLSALMDVLKEHANDDKTANRAGSKRKRAGARKRA